MANEFQYDVFVSYSSNDKEWVRGELLKRIEATGLKAFIDFRDFTRGAPSIKEMERGVEICRKTLFVLTPDYLESEWCEIENIMAASFGPANRDLRMIPLLKIPCDKPKRIGALTHIDFTDGADYGLAWKQLLISLGKPPEPTPAAQPTRDLWNLAHPYAMPPNFTGRKDERKMLADWLNADSKHPLFVLRALGGFGKSALCWHWLMKDVDPVQWPRVVWWSFYECDAGFENFIADTLRYLSNGLLDARAMPPREQLNKLVHALHQTGTLLVLDGFERALRAFGGLNAAYQGDEAVAAENDLDCISPLAELFLRSIATLPNIQAKVLLTTRLCPRILKAHDRTHLHGCREEELAQLKPSDAVDFFHAQGIRGTPAEIEFACKRYGYHPLSLRLLAGLIVNDFKQPGDITASNQLDVSGDLIQRQHHVLEQSYNSLANLRKKLFSRIACFRGPMEYEALKVVANPIETLDADLRDLVARGLLQYNAKAIQFDLHPIVRRYAYDQLTASNRVTAHTKLRNYFATVRMPDKIEHLEDLAPVIELYHHTVRAGHFDQAQLLFFARLNQPTYYQLCAYQLRIYLLRELFPDGENHPPRLKDDDSKGWLLNALGNSYQQNGQPRLALSLVERHNAIREKQRDANNLVVGLTNLAEIQMPVGLFQAASANVLRCIDLHQGVQMGGWTGVGHLELGRLLAYRGDFNKSETELVRAFKMFEQLKHLQPQGLTWVYRALLTRLQLRAASYSTQSLNATSSLLNCAQQALKLADEWARTHYPMERDYVRAHWLLGAAHLASSKPDEAEREFNESLERCRSVNLVECEADILIDLARLRIATGSKDEAQSLLEEASLITKRSGYVLQGADAYLELAKLALAHSDKKTAKEHAQKAKDLATCDGPPDYTYKVAYDEALALLNQLDCKGGIP